MAMTVPSGPTASASRPANSPAPLYRSRAVSPGCGLSARERGCRQRAGRSRMDLPEAAQAHAPVPARGALGEVAAAAHRNMRPGFADELTVSAGTAGSWRAETGPETSSPRSPVAGATLTSTDLADGHRWPVTLAAVTRSCAIRHRSTGTISCERCAAQARSAGPVDRERHHGPPAEASVTVSLLALTFAGAVHLDDLDLPVDAADAAELLADDLSLERPLGGQAGVLPVAAAAAAGPRVAARRGHPVC